MDKIIKTKQKLVFTSDINLSLANAIRRSANEIPILAVDEVDIYKNDSALYDEIVAHRIGLLPLVNQKVKEGDHVEMKLKFKASGKPTYVLSGEFGEGSVYESIPIVLLDKEQELEVVAKAKQGKGIEHAKYSPGLVHYRILNNIELSKEAEKQQELAELYPETFSFENGKVKVKNAWAFDLDIEDLEEFKGVKLTPTEEIVFIIESWGQIDAEDIFLDSIKALNRNLEEVSKELK